MARRAPTVMVSAFGYICTCTCSLPHAKMPGHSLAEIMNKTITREYTLEMQMAEIRAVTAAGGERGARTRTKTKLFGDSSFAGNRRENSRDAPAPAALSDSENEASDEEYAGENGTDDVLTLSPLPAAGNEASDEVRAETEKSPAASGAKGRRSAARSNTSYTGGRTSTNNPMKPKPGTPSKDCLQDFTTSTITVESKRFTIGPVISKVWHTSIYFTQDRNFVLKFQLRSPGTPYQITTESHALRSLRNVQYMQQYVAYGQPEGYGNCYVLVTGNGGLDMLKSSVDGVLTEKQILDICRQIAEGPKQLHERDMVHRDIKPDNIVTKDGVATLIDFGCALERRDRKGQLITTPQDGSGTPPYQSTGVGKQCLRFYDDWFALCMTMLRMCMKLLPWEQDPKTTPAKMYKMKIDLIENGLPVHESISGTMHAMFNKWLAHFKQVYEPKNGKPTKDVDPKVLISLMEEAARQLK